jgi:hypothetical protein
MIAVLMIMVLLGPLYSLDSRFGWISDVIKAILYIFFSAVYLLSSSWTSAYSTVQYSPFLYYIGEHVFTNYFVDIRRFMKVNDIPVNRGRFCETD